MQLGRPLGYAVFALISTSHCTHERGAEFKHFERCTHSTFDAMLIRGNNDDLREEMVAAISIRTPATATIIRLALLQTSSAQVL